MSNDARRLIEDYASDAAHRSGLAEPQRSDARAELESHLFDAAVALAKPGSPTRQHARQAIAALGTPADVDAAFFASERSSTPRATWGVRIGSFLIDALIVIIVTSLLTLPFQSPWQDQPDANGAYTCQGFTYIGIKFWSYEEVGANDKNPCEEQFAMQALLQAIHAVGFLLYFGLWEGLAGRTPGKMALGLRVLREDGTTVRSGRAFSRSITKALFPLIVLDWLIGLGTKERKQRVSDIAAKTMVVRER